MIIPPIKPSTRHYINQSNHCKQTVTFRYKPQLYCHITRSLMAAKDVANQSSTLASHIVWPVTKESFRIWESPRANFQSGTSTAATANNPKCREISLPGAMKWTNGVTISKYSDSLDQARRTFQSPIRCRSRRKALLNKRHIFQYHIITNFAS
jgi:hypothetical protein